MAFKLSAEYIAACQENYNKARAANEAKAALYDTDWAGAFAEIVKADPTAATWFPKVWSKEGSWTITSPGASGFTPEAQNWQDWKSTNPVFKSWEAKLKTNYKAKAWLAANPQMLSKVYFYGAATLDAEFEKRVYQDQKEFIDRLKEVNLESVKAMLKEEMGSSLAWLDTNQEKDLTLIAQALVDRLMADSQPGNVVKKDLKTEAPIEKPTTATVGAEPAKESAKPAETPTESKTAELKESPKPSEATSLASLIEELKKIGPIQTGDVVFSAKFKSALDDNAMASASGVKQPYSKEELNALQVKAAYQEWKTYKSEGIIWPDGWGPGTENYSKVFPEEAAALGNKVEKGLSTETAKEAPAAQPAAAATSSPESTSPAATEASEAESPKVDEFGNSTETAAPQDGVLPAGGAPTLVETEQSAPALDDFGNPIPQSELGQVKSKGLSTEGEVPIGTPSLKTGEVAYPEEEEAGKKGGIRGLFNKVTGAIDKASSAIEGLGTGTLEKAAGKTKAGRAIEKYSPSNLLEKITSPLSGAVESVTTASVSKGITKALGKKKEKALPSEEVLTEVKMPSVSTTINNVAPAQSTGVTSQNLGDQGTLPKGQPVLTETSSVTSPLESTELGKPIEKALTPTEEVSTALAGGSTLSANLASQSNQGGAAELKTSSAPSAAAAELTGGIKRSALAGVTPLAEPLKLAGSDMASLTGSLNSIAETNRAAQTTGLTGEGSGSAQTSGSTESQSAGSAGAGSTSNTNNKNNIVMGGGGGGGQDNSAAMLALILNKLNSGLTVNIKGYG